MNVRFKTLFIFFLLTIKQININVICYTYLQTFRFTHNITAISLVSKEGVYRFCIAFIYAHDE